MKIKLKIKVKKKKKRLKKLWGEKSTSGEIKLTVIGEV